MNQNDFCNKCFLHNKAKDKKKARYNFKNIFLNFEFYFPIFIFSNFVHILKITFEKVIFTKYSNFEFLVFNFILFQF